MRRRARDAHAAKAADNVEQSFQGVFALGVIWEMDLLAWFSVTLISREVWEKTMSAYKGLIDYIFLGFD